MRSIRFLILLMFGLLLAGSVMPVQAAEIVILGNESKPPKIYLKDGEPQGILVDIVRYIDERIDDSLTIQLYPWKRAYAMALGGQGAVVGLSMTKGRLGLFDFSEVLYHDELLLVVLQGQEFPYNSIEDLKGKRVGVQRGSNYGEGFQEAKEFLTLDLDNAGEQRLMKLLAGRIDVALIGPGRAGLDAVIASHPQLSQNRESFVVLETPFALDPNYLGFAKSMNGKPLLEQINAVLREGHGNGEIQEIINRHSPKGGDHQPPE